MPSPDSANNVVLSDDQRDVEIDDARWAKFALSVIDALGVRGMELSVSFVDRDTIAELNRMHLGGDGSATDVLAFPLDDVVFHHANTSAPAGDGPVPMLGDIVVCPAVASAQAPRHAGSLDDELALLVVHAALHLVGHDHGEDAQRDAMQAEERRLLAALHGPLGADPWRSPPGSDDGP